MTGTTLRDLEEVSRPDEYLDELDTARQTCRDAIEGAQAEHGARRAELIARYEEIVDRAWSDYQQAASAPSVPRRRDHVAVARGAFNAAAAAASQDRDAGLFSAAEEYLSSLERICDRYEGAVDVAVSAAASATATSLERSHASLAAA